MENVHDIAKWFLSKEAMTHKKLQKLCYYAQVWHLALLEGKKLFDDDIEAWVHGPVIPELYREYSHYGWTKIPQKEFNEELLAPEDLDVLYSVYETYKELSGDELEILTHNEAPWQNARGNLAPYEPCKNNISLEDMRSYYLTVYEASQND